MLTQSEIISLRERLAKAEALAARGATPGERAAARTAVERIRQRLGAHGHGAFSGSSAPPPPPRMCEFRFRIRDPWGQRVFQALCEAEGYAPYRRKRQRQSTFLVKVPNSAAGRSLFNRYCMIELHLKRELRAVTERVFKERVKARA
jgi:hypothetical protein